jgi:uncharacterized membrane protein
MTQSTQPTGFFDTLRYWLNRQARWFVRHWLLVINIILGIYVTLPYLAPLLMYYGYTTVANYIYFAYRMTCHQLPSRSYTIFEHQVAVCHRCTAIWIGILLGGFIFLFIRRTIPFHWLVLVLIPMGLDGGTQLAGLLYEVLPGWILTGFAVSVWLLLTAILWMAGVSRWQYYVFVLCFPLGMIFVHLGGPRSSNWLLRSITGGLFGLAYAWLLFPAMQETFQEYQENLAKKVVVKKMLNT